MSSAKIHSKGWPVVLGTAVLIFFLAGIAAGQIDIEKDTNGEDADNPPGPSILVGDPITWTYVVTNITDPPRTLRSVVVTDDQGVSITCTWPIITPPGVLLAGNQATCTANGTAQEG